MLSAEENEFLTRVGPGTPMGELMRQYWLPVLLSEELPEPDGRPERVRLLGEDLIAFRATDGRVGLVQNNCPHRGASLFFGRNEEDGLRCVYHGWKFDVSGKCVDMPNEPAESNFKDKVHVRAYPCVERNGIVWTYMGPRETPPPLPEYEFATVPALNRLSTPFVRECNWLQALEGDIDSAHSSFLHSVLNKQDIGDLGTGLKHVDRHPRFEVLDTDFGVTIAARRTPEDPDRYYWRLTQFLFPIVTYFPPTGEQMETVPGHIWVPIDDHNTLVWTLRWHPQKALRGEQSLDRTLAGRGVRGGRSAFEGPEEYLPPTTEPAGRWRFVANKSNDYLLDYEAQKTRRFSGVPTIPLQDQAMTESMGPVMDRTAEHLGSTDAGIIRVRRALAQAARALAEDGVTPPGVDNPQVFRVRSASGLLPKDVNWIEGTRSWTAAVPDVPVMSA
jgi:phthalate 4,5-dioxygenase oxygenase subunit